MAVKYGLGKFARSLPYEQWMTTAIADLGLIVLPITVEFSGAQVQRPFLHGDPFDRVLIAQS
ncbi:MAG: hypothetical protein IT427_03785 [Pirellulales bacterium]|nr:hypothetical protein [Pirellulales bacterium]